jgi:hypothetical protein
MLFKSSKINEFRLWGLLLTLGGMGMMIVGLVGIVFDWGSFGRVLAFISMVVGMISMMGSVAVYMWAGMLSTSAQVVVCPECGKMTKVLGKTDRCMSCHTILSFDQKYAPPTDAAE